MCGILGLSSTYGIAIRVYNNFWLFDVSEYFENQANRHFGHNDKIIK